MNAGGLTSVSRKGCENPRRVQRYNAHLCITHTHTHTHTHMCVCVCVCVCLCVCVCALMSTRARGWIVRWRKRMCLVQLTTTCVFRWRGRWRKRKEGEMYACLVQRISLVQLTTSTVERKEGEMYAGQGAGAKDVFSSVNYYYVCV